MGFCWSKISLLCRGNDAANATIPLTDIRPQSPTNTADNIYVALYDYVARTSEDLTFKKDDKMELINPNEGDWWVVRLIDQDYNTSKLEGYVPSNYIAKCSSLESQPWYFGKLERGEVSRLLKQRHNPTGAFMIRESTSKPNEYALTVLHENVCRHYLICRINDGGRDKLYVKRKFQTSTFLSLNELVAHYQSTDGGTICTRLTEPCRKDENPQTDGLSHELADKYEVDHSEFKLGKKVGEGNFGQVFEGLWNGTTKVAVKTLKQGTMEEESFLKEAKLMKKLRHPKLVQLYAVCTRSQPFYIVTELMCNGSLLSYLKENDLNISTLIDIAAQIASGMAYLETNNYIHRDLAARNILVGKNNCVKVADFGLARAIKEEIYQSQSKTLPVKWSAPEALLHQIFSIKSDVWSFGILLTEIIGRGRVPYPGWNNKEVLDQIESGYRMPQLPDCPDSLYAIMKNCWDTDPKNRDSFETLLWKLEDAYSSFFYNG